MVEADASQAAVPRGEDALERWQVAIELARAFLPDDPMNAWPRLEEIAGELRAAAGAQPELTPLITYVSSLAEHARAAADKWQSESAERERHFHAREFYENTLHLDIDEADEAHDYMPLSPWLLLS